MTTDQVASDREEALRERRNRWQALAVCLTAGGMCLLDVGIVNVALPSIRTGLAASDRAVQWVVAGYSLAFGMALVPAGRLGDARSRRSVFLVGVAVFTLASAACGAATTPTWIAVSRVLQGIGGGLITPQISGSSRTCSAARNAEGPSACSARRWACPPPSGRCWEVC